MRVGSLVFATDQGLGRLAKDFYDNGIVTDPLVVRHPHHPNHPEWYPDARGFISGRDRGHDLRQAEELCDAVDVMLFFETPFYWSLIDYCKRRGTKAVLMPMYECMPKEIPTEPDLWLCPSLLDLSYYRFGPLIKPPPSIEVAREEAYGTVQENHSGRRSCFIPVPVCQTWRLREQAKVFVHNAGHGGLKGRNGTGELLDAIRLVQTPMTFILRSQKSLPWGLDRIPGYVTLIPEIGTQPYENLYKTGDVFVFPEKFNGLSLPLQEAFAAGMLVMSTDRFPMNTWLPLAPLIPQAGERRTCIASRLNDFAEAVIDPKVLAETLDAWNGKAISHLSEQGRDWAVAHSWESLKPVYKKTLEAL